MCVVCLCVCVARVSSSRITTDAHLQQVLFITGWRRGRGWTGIFSYAVPKLLNTRKLSPVDYNKFALNYLGRYIAIEFIKHIRNFDMLMYSSGEMCN